jgi:hypothetical protein
MYVVCGRETVRPAPWGSLHTLARQLFNCLVYLDCEAWEEGGAPRRPHNPGRAAPSAAEQSQGLCVVCVVCVCVCVCM